MNIETIKTLEFGKLEKGGKFYLGNPIGLPDTSVYTKVESQKGPNGTWFNAKNKFGMPAFVQYDKRIWTK